MYKESAFIFFWFFLLFHSCNKSASYRHSVGDHFGGGIVVYVDSSGEHGLVAAMFDLAVAGYGPWGVPNPDDSFDIGYPFKQVAQGNWISPLATDTSVMSGDANSILIDSFFHNGTDATDLCRKLTLNGYNDWSLPSSGAAREMCKAQNFLGGINDTAIYWTSTIISPNRSDSGVAYVIFKNNLSGSVSYTCACCNPDNCCSTFGLARPVRKF
jgi:hypothetical protein